MTKILFVINPISGDIDKEDLEEDLVAFCQRHQISASFFRTTGEQDEQKLQQEIEQGQPDVVVAMGGDGTVNLVAKLLIDSPTQLAIIPQGSGNGLSKDLDIPQDFEEALHLLAEHKVKAIDTLQVSGHHSIHLCDMGFNALVVKRFCEGDTRGPGAYAWIAMQEYMSYEPKRYTVISEGETLFDGEAFMLTVTNAKAFGSNATINPNGVINDGKFEICILEPFPKTASLGILYRMYTDSIDDSIYTQRFSCRSATILNHAREVTHIDGEPVDLPEKIEFKVRPQSLHVLLPTPGEQEG
ncbi:MULTISPECIES: diacylglycerol/lipid kinase family protein [Rufibacter]|uniref:Diacylglycerol kinase family enzyme n=1 Tax=Rufibacter quisquiliarum TaxID=1549639 RepID=A0A839GVE2_9BACT|nr:MULTISPECIES: diacylglycerol kinase family protein [Rufibacter]MBA9078716.1 diacylglycerol kinase family enzyme [Rufibacter quisquiliarum]